MNSLFESTLNIVRGFQSTWDGGVVAFLIDDVLFPPNGSEKASPQEHFVNRVLHGGYAAALSVGIIWIILLLSAMIFLCVMHARRKQSSKATLLYKMMAHRIERTHRQWREHWICVSVRFIFSFALVFLLIVAAITALIASTHLHNAVTSPPPNSDNSSSRSGGDSGPPKGVFPRLIAALGLVHNYALEFGEDALIATRPVVDDIIWATERMQNDTMKSFNAVLMKKLGVEKTFGLGDKMAVNIFTMFDHSTILQDISKNMNSKMDELNRALGIIRYLKKSMMEVLNTTCDSSCDRLILEFSNFSYSRVIQDDLLGFSKTFLDMMAKQGQTKESIQANMNFGKEQLRTTMEKTYLRSKTLMNIPGTIRNMTDETWYNMSIKMEEDTKGLENMTHMLSGKGHESAVKYEGIVFLLSILAIILLLVIAIISGIVIVHFHCSSEDYSDVCRNRFKLCLYTLLSFLAFVVCLSTVLFLVGGYLETETCRYLGPNQPRFGPNRTLYLDMVINRFLDNHWASIEEKMSSDPSSSGFPLPRPKNVIYAVTQQCRKDMPVLEALDAVDSIDPKALEKPELSAKFVRIGRQLMHEQLLETDPTKMQPANIEQDLQDAQKVDLFVANISFPNRINRVLNYKYLQRPKESPLAGQQVNRSEVFNSFNIFKQRYSSVTSITRLIKDTNKVLTEIFGLVQVLESMKLPIVESLGAYGALNATKPIVLELIAQLKQVNGLMGNKTAVIGIADDLFTEIIEKTTPEKARKVMEKYGPKMMGKLGPCRPIYEAFNNVHSAVCQEIVPPLNGLWFCLGWGAFVATPLLGLVLALLTKKFVRSPVKQTSVEGDPKLPKSEKEESIEMLYGDHPNGDA